MPKVTAIKPQKRPGRFNIYLDGKFSFGIDSLTLVAKGLGVGKIISEAEVEKLIDEKELQKLVDRAINFLSFRPRSEREVVDYLSKKGVGEKERNVILDKIRALRLVNDEEFAQWWVEQRQTFRPKGARAIKQELRRKGIGREVIEKVKLAPQQEKENAWRLLEKRWPVWLRGGKQEARKKAGSFLARRGFDWEVIESVVDRAELG